MQAERGCSLSPPPRVAVRARARALAASHFTYEGILDRIAEFIADPEGADLVCMPKPPSLLGHAGW